MLTEILDGFLKGAILGALFGILVVLIMLFRRRSDESVAAELHKAIKRFGEAAAHHAEVNAVLALTKQFQENPELLYNLSGYSRQVVAAALSNRVNSLGNEINRAQKDLNFFKGQVYQGKSSYESRVDKNEELLENLLGQLTAANEAVQQFVGQTV